jgi:hypothetical protein
LKTKEVGEEDREEGGDVEEDNVKEAVFLMLLLALVVVVVLVLVLGLERV